MIQPDHPYGIVYVAFQKAFDRNLHHAF